jgi:hypothetical protein
MTRLDEFIVRMQAQRACIDAAAALTAGQPGPVLELGLGNGRTYDHLRQRFTQRAIFVFDREVAAHPDCIPDPDFLRLGDFRSSLPAYLAEGHPPAVFIHADIGSANRRKSAELAADLAPIWRDILMPGGFLACDQRIALDGLLPLPLPSGMVADNYHFYRRAG